MAAMELFCKLTGVNIFNLTLQEKLIFEINLFAKICDELLKNFNETKGFNFLKHNGQKEISMLEGNVVKYIIEDLLVTEDYSLKGMAYYTQFPEEAIDDVLLGKNQMPSLELSRKLIELHRTARPQLYKEIIKKILQDYLDEDREE